MAKKHTKKKQPWYLENLNLGHVSIPVRVVPDLPVFGQYSDCPKPEIVLGLQDESVVASTLFHELLHAASAAYELNLTERQVRCLDQLIPLMLIQNPNLTNHLICKQDD
jgi:hypothetical protein